ncbi:hypothetical protein [Nonomuraea dietziae]|uniref:hypothetical protein n=1 Tax=Nonomuraea dietziae TaxID=65515 RepID=UPI0031CE5DA5
MALRPRSRSFVDRLVEPGVRQPLSRRRGGTYAQMWPYEHLARRASSFPSVRSAIAAELIVSGDVTLGERSVVIFTSVSGTTDDSIRAFVRFWRFWLVWEFPKLV